MAMTFEEFVEEIKRELPARFPELSDGREMKIQEVNKVNESYMGLVLSGAENEAIPTLNLNMLYDDYYVHDQDMDAILGLSKEILSMKVPEHIARITADMKDYEKMRPNLIARVCSADRNSEILKEMPHMIMEDLVITYGIQIPGGDMMIAKVTNDVMEDWGITESKLHEDAMISSAGILPARITSLFQEIGMEDDVESGDDPGMLLVTNDLRMLGAVSIFYKGVMDEVAERMHGDYFILPSSIHEVIVVPDNGEFILSHLEEMVRDANHSFVAEQDVLTDTVYHYDAEEKLFEKARDYLARTAELTEVILPGRLCTQIRNYAEEGKVNAIFTFPKGTEIKGRDLSNAKILLEGDMGNTLSDGIKVKIPNQIKMMSIEGKPVHIKAREFKEAVSSFSKEHAPVVRTEELCRSRPDVALEL